MGLDVEYATLEQDLRLLPAMMQIADDERVILMRLASMPKDGKLLFSSCPSLVRLLESTDILKVREFNPLICTQEKSWPLRNGSFT